MNKHEVTGAARDISRNMSKAEHETAREDIADQYKSDKSACKAMVGNARHVCMAEAKGRRQVAKAGLEANYRPSEKHQHELNTARLDAAYATARENCGSLSGDAKDVCRNEAKGAHLAAKGEAKLAAQAIIASARNVAAEARRNAAAANRDVVSAP